MKTFQIKINGEQIDIEYDTKESSLDVMLSVIDLLGRHIQNIGKGEKLQQQLNTLSARNETLTEFKKLEGINDFEMSDLANRPLYKVPTPIFTILEKDKNKL
jgi:hypothetical protein